MEMINNIPKVSIIVPIYKVECYLRECIDSVLNQTFSDFELILVDDGSPDGSPAICDEYAKKDSRIHVIHKENGGLSSARNAGLDVAVGQYVYFLDSDDAIVPEMLDTVVVHMDKGMDMVAFRFFSLYEDGRKEPGRPFSYGEYTAETPNARKDLISKVIIPGKIGWGAWSRMFVREKIEQYGLRFADNRKIFAEDLYFSLCYCAHADRVMCIDDCLYYYRLRADSIMGVQIKKSNIGRIHALCREVLAYYQRFEDCSVLTEHFSQIYFQIIAGQFVYQMWSSGMHPVDFRKTVIAEVEDWAYLERNIRQQLAAPGELKKCYAMSAFAELKYNMEFLLGGSWTTLRIRCKLLRIFQSLTGCK